MVKTPFDIPASKVRFGGNIYDVPEGPSDGQVLGFNEAGHLEWVDGGVGDGGVSEVIAFEELSADATTITFNDLDGDNDEFYEIDCYFKITQSSSNITLRPNGDTANLSSQIINSTTSTDHTDWRLMTTSGGSVPQYMFMTIRLFAGRVIGQTSVNRFYHSIGHRLWAATSGSAHQGGGSYADQSTNLTSLEFVHSATDGFLAGTKIIVRKVLSTNHITQPENIWVPAISEPVILGGTATSFTIADNVSLDEDDEWKLSLRLKLATGTTHQIRLGPRGTFVDGTNYSSESFRSGDTTVATLSPDDEIQLGTFNAPDSAKFDVYISKRAGERTIFHWSGTHNQGNTPRSWTGGGVDVATTDITRIDLGSTASDSLLAGSEAMLYKRGKISSISTVKTLFKKRVTLAAASTTITLTGLDGNKHKRYRVRAGGTIVDTTLDLEVQWNGEATGYVGRLFNHVTNTGTTQSTWKVSDNTFASGIQFSLHGELMSDLTAVTVPYITIRSRTTETSPTNIGSQTFDGFLDIASPTNLTSLVLSSADVMGIGSYLEVEEMTPAE